MGWKKDTRLPITFSDRQFNKLLETLFKAREGIGDNTAFLEKCIKYGAFYEDENDGKVISLRLFPSESIGLISQLVLALSCDDSPAEKEYYDKFIAIQKRYSKTGDVTYEDLLVM